MWETCEPVTIRTYSKLGVKHLDLIHFFLHALKPWVIRQHNKKYNNKGYYPKNNWRQWTFLLILIQRFESRFHQQRTKGTFPIGQNWKYLFLCQMWNILFLWYICRSFRFLVMVPFWWKYQKKLQYCIKFNWTYSDEYAVHLLLFVNHWTRTESLTIDCLLVRLCLLVVTLRKVYSGWSRNPWERERLTAHHSLKKITVNC